MSLSEHITRINNARDKIRNKLVSLGLVESSAKIEVLATAVEGITNNGSVEATVKEGETYNIPEGYHDGTGSVAGVAGGGNYKLQNKTVTPTKSQQAITSDDGYYGLSGVTVKAIPETYQDVSSVNALATDVLATKIYVAADGTVTPGTMPNNGAINATIDGLTSDSYDIPAGYTSGGTVTLTNAIVEALAAI